jgi:Zn-dependent protease/CBS domain-containing protein
VIALGRIAAIPIRVHWSWPLLFLATVAVMRPTYARATCDGLAPCGADVGLAALLAALLGASVLLHELGHAVVASWHTVPVHAITLFAFGGVAELEGESPHPGADLAIAVAGPAVSLLIAAAAGLLWWARGGPVAADGPALLAAHLALANGVVALFNLPPSYPLDGGRVLRAALWFLDDDPLPATRRAAEVGRACALLIALGGIVVAFGARAPLAALWAAVVGVVLFRAATASHRQSLLQAALRGVTVGDLMQRRLRTVAADLALEQFVARYVLGQAETAFAVVADAPDAGGEPPALGLITLRDLRRFSMAHWSALRVAEAMRPVGQLVALDPDTPALDALNALNGSPDGLLPVARGGELVGLLRQRDLALFVQVQLARPGAETHR